jgi:23S rRNA pseudouridine1911/1915/1917 synthase
MRLDKYLAGPERLGSRRRVSVALERGQVFVNEREAGLEDAGTPLTAGDVVRLWMDRPGSAKRGRTRSRITGDLEILYEDDGLIVVNKPPGILSIPLQRRTGAESVYDQLIDYFRPRGRRRPFVVHRIDRDTSGLVVFAKDGTTARNLKDQFKRRDPERVYWAVVYGQPVPSSGRWHDRLVWDEKALIQKKTHQKDPKGSEAICTYRTIETFADASLIEVRLETGRRNQIRIQARLHGHMLVGEKRYVSEPSPPPRPIPFERQALHAFRLVFRNPADNQRLAFEASLPADFSALLARLRRV